VGELAGQGVGEDDGGVSLIEVGEEPPVDAFEVILEGSVETGGENREALVVAFRFADEDLVVLEIEVLDAQAEAFHEAQAAAVEELGHELVFAGEVAEDEADLVAAEDSGDAAGGAGAGGADRRFEGLAEDGAVQEEDGAEGLILGGRGDAFVDGQVGEERLDLLWAEVPGIAVFVEGQEAFEPEEVAAFRAKRVVFAAEDRASAIDQP
jgi:hypothetical protein